MVNYISCVVLCVLRTRVNVKRREHTIFRLLCGKKNGRVEDMKFHRFQFSFLLTNINVHLYFFQINYNFAHKNYSAYFIPFSLCFSSFYPLLCITHSMGMRWTEWKGREENEKHKEFAERVRLFSTWIWNLFQCYELFFWWIVQSRLGQKESLLKFRLRWRKGMANYMSENYISILMADIF